MQVTITTKFQPLAEALSSSFRHMENLTIITRAHGDQQRMIIPSAILLIRVLISLTLFHVFMTS